MLMRRRNAELYPGRVTRRSSDGSGVFVTLGKRIGHGSPDTSAYQFLVWNNPFRFPSSLFFSEILSGWSNRNFIKTIYLRLPIKMVYVYCRGKRMRFFLKRIFFRFPDREHPDLDWELLHRAVRSDHRPREADGTRDLRNGANRKGWKGSEPLRTRWVSFPVKK